MSTAIHAAFARARGEGRAAFIPFMTGGFPDGRACRELLLALDQSGADVIEVGIPFSDPLADGPVIQAASKQALDQGATPAGVLAMIKDLRPDLQAAVVVMTYYNPVLAMGLEAFAQAARRAGVDGVIVPDLPPEEAGPWLQAARNQSLDTIFMAAPTTTEERLAGVNQVCRGFLYYVSLTGVTGAGLTVDQALADNLARARRASELPVAVGFGVSTPDQARALGGLADGVIVGSALVKRVLEAADSAQGVAEAAGLARELRQALATPH